MYFALRTEEFAKLFFLISCTGLFLYAILAFYTFHTAYTSMGQSQSSEDLNKDFVFTDHDYNNVIASDNDLKYILFWTHPNIPLNSIPEGQQIFIDYKCEYTNCFLTTNKNILKKDYKNFDAIVFNISVVKNWKKIYLPQTRSPRQKYIFYSLESSDDSPVCNVNADNYFNWTWTYKLNSDIVSPFIEVTDLQGNVVAPKFDVKWTTNLTIFEEEETNAIKPKRKALAWIMNKCNTRNDRKVFIQELEAELKMNFRDFDIYGCGNLKCPRGRCLEEIENSYYFYLAYEDSIAEDYVTAEVTKAYLHDAVPVVIGGADYRKFLPDGSYINAKSKSADQLAAKMDYIIRNPYIYYGYFHWRKSYSIHESEEFKGLCDICAYLNDDSKFGTFSVYKNFRKWWYSGSLYDRCIPKGAESLSEVLSYINKSFHI